MLFKTHVDLYLSISGSTKEKYGDVSYFNFAIFVCLRKRKLETVFQQSCPRERTNFRPSFPPLLCSSPLSSLLSSLSFPFLSIVGCKFCSITKEEGTQGQWDRFVLFSYTKLKFTQKE